MAGSSPFTVMTNIFVTEFSETFRKSSIIHRYLSSDAIDVQLFDTQYSISVILTNYKNSLKENCEQFELFIVNVIPGPF